MPATDLNWLLGVTALQIDFISRDALIDAMQVWVGDKDRSLVDILRAAGHLSERQAELLLNLAQAHIRRNGGTAIAGGGYRLLWIHSMGKAISDDASRMKSIQKTIDDLNQLRDRLQSPRSRMRDRPRLAGEVEKIMQCQGTGSLLQVEIMQEEEVTLKYKTPGRRSENTQYV